MKRHSVVVTREFTATVRIDVVAENGEGAATRALELARSEGVVVPASYVHCDPPPDLEPYVTDVSDSDSGDSVPCGVPLPWGDPNIVWQAKVLFDSGNWREVNFRISGARSENDLKEAVLRHPAGWGGFLVVNVVEEPFPECVEKNEILSLHRA